MELLAPARDLETLKAAFDAGADAVYLGLKKFSARMRAKNFTFDELSKAARLKKSLGKKIYTTINTLILEEEISELLETLAFLESEGIDAVIIQDYGVYEIAKDLQINLPLHASTQMGVKNHVQAQFLEKLGFKRTVLERQLCLDEIASIKRHTKMELEVFIHGAMCFSLSGYCFFSQTLTGRSGNRGECAQPCRWRFSDEKGKDAYPFSMKDLEGIGALSALKKAGVASLKIEGRMKGIGYVYHVVSAYRKAVDIVKKDSLTKKDISELQEELCRSTLSRSSGTGFFLFPSKEPLTEPEGGGTGLFLGKAASVTATSLFFNTSESLHVGDTVRVDDPKTDKRYKIPVKALYLSGKKVRSISAESYAGIPSPYRLIPAGAKIYLVHRREAYKSNLKLPETEKPDAGYKNRAKLLYERYLTMYGNTQIHSPAIHNLTFNPDSETYSSGDKKLLFIPPDIYENNVGYYKKLPLKGADGYFISHPCEAVLLKDKKTYGSFFLYVTNLAALHFYKALGIQGFSVCFDGYSSNLQLSKYSSLWFRWKNLPLWVTRVPVKTGLYRLKTKKEVKIAVKGKWGMNK